VLNVVGLTHPTEFHNVSFTLRRGEILGFYGLVGAGRSETMRAIMGLNPNATGHLEMCGKRLVVQKPGDAIAAGIAYVPEERQRQGGILSFSVQHNISLAGLKHFANMGWLSHSKETSISHRMIERLRIKTSTQDTLLSGLSGGNQQKVVIGKWLGLDPQIVILDEPTKGIDVGAKQAVYQLIVEMVNQGLAVILVSSELPEVLNLAHRTIVMRRGLQVAEFSKEDVRAENVVAVASGLDKSHTVIEEVSA
jgi:rhamnose transport system ATP-binding protein